MVEFMSRDESEPSESRLRRCGVDISADNQGTPQSAVARTVFYHGHGESQTQYETRIAFVIRDGIAQVTGFVEPEQLSTPHFKTVPAACEQVAQVAGIESVEQPEETLSRHFAHGRIIANRDD